MGTNNVFLSFADGASLLIYTAGLSAETCKKWAEKALKKRVEDAYEIPDNDLQYYCIDERVWNSAEDDKRVIEYVG